MDYSLSIGIDKYINTFGATSVSPLGGIRAYMNNDWYSIFAVGSAAGVDWYRASGTALTGISSTASFTTANDVHMAELNGQVVAVNSVDDPIVCHFSGTFMVQTLDSYDVRTRGTSTWYGGAYEASASGSSQWVDDTTDLQSTATADFIFATTATSDGFYFACNYTYNKLVLYNVHQLTCNAGLAVAYEYYEGSNSWSALTMVASATWTDATGTRTLEWDWPSDWTDYDNLYGNLGDRFVMRVRFTTPPTTTGTLAYAKVSHTQYLTQILGNDKPQAVTTHGNRVFMAAGYIVNLSPFNEIVGWEYNDSEYFTEGGSKIEAMISHGEYLFIVKDKGLYGFYGDSYLNWRREMLDENRGTISGRSVKEAGNYVWFMDRDGLYRWDGRIAIKVSKHIQTDIDNYTKTDSAAVNFKQWYFIDFPTDGEALMFDPDTYRTDPTGDGRVSFYKFTADEEYHTTQFLKYEGGGDIGGLYGLSETPSGTWYVAQFDNAVPYDDITSTATVTAAARISDWSFNRPQEIERFGIFKPHMAGASATEGAGYIFTMYGRYGAVEATTTASGTMSTNSFSKDLRVPYTIDGKTFGVEWRHNTLYDATLQGFSIDYEKRYY